MDTSRETWGAHIYMNPPRPLCLSHTLPATYTNALAGVDDCTAATHDKSSDQEERALVVASFCEEDAWTLAGQPERAWNVQNPRERL